MFVVNKCLLLILVCILFTIVAFYGQLAKYVEINRRCSVIMHAIPTLNPMERFKGFTADTCPSFLST